MLGLSGSIKKRFSICPLLLKCNSNSFRKERQHVLAKKILNWGQRHVLGLEYYFLPMGRGGALSQEAVCSVVLHPVGLRHRRIPARSQHIAMPFTSHHSFCSNSHTMPCGERWERKRKKLAFLHRARPTRAKTKSWLQKAGEADVISLPGLWGDLQEKQGASRERGARAVSGIQKQEQCLISSKKSESEEWYSLFRCVQKRSSEESEQDFGNWIPKL